MNEVQAAQELIRHILPGQRIFVQGGAATPNRILAAVCEDHKRLQGCELIHLHTIGPASYGREEYNSDFKVANLFVGPNLRKQMTSPHVDYLPCFLSEIPNLFRSQKRKLDVALIHVSPPDKHGFCSLGVSVDVARAAVDSASLVLAQINDQMPRVHGDGLIHVSAIHSCIRVNEALPESEAHEWGAEEKKIGQFISEIVPNGATLQVGIGSIPEAALSALSSHRNLGVHTETWSDGVMQLIECGAIDNSLKSIHPGKVVAAFGIGSKKFYNFIDDNPSVLHLDASYINSPAIIARNQKVVAINSAVEIDLTGQVCADSIGPRIISGVGGQMDFIRGASLSKGGLPIIAITSRTKKGKPRIVPILNPGAGVVTTRAHVHYVVTEYGICDLYGKTVQERARELIRLSHPEDREMLAREFQKIYKTVIKL